jgi:AAA ATPase domain
MKPISIEIKNYRSINSISIPIESLSDGTRTFGLIGVNEAGKSSILKALNLTTLNATLNPKDFRQPNTPVLISIEYQLESKFQDAYPDEAIDMEPEVLAKTAQCDRIVAQYQYQTPGSAVAISYWAKALNDLPILIPGFLPSALRVYRPIFWTAEEKYLISKPISISQFSANPGDISIPLRNCFSLAGCDDINVAVGKLVDSTEIERSNKFSC